MVNRRFNECVTRIGGAFMLIYHGSKVIVDKPLISESRENTDFGRGFYTTDIEQQAINWAKRRGSLGYVSKYDLDDYIFQDSSIIIKKFSKYDEEWLDYIISCRNGNPNGYYDIIIGPMADDRVYNTIELYMEDIASKEQTLQGLKFPVKNNQICFRNQNILNKYLKFIGVDEYVGK